MAQEKISFNPALMSLPLLADPSRLTRCDCRDGSVQPWDFDNRTLVQLPEHWQPGLFFIRKAGSDSAKFVVHVYEAKSGTLVRTFASAQLTDLRVFRRPAATQGGQAWDTVTVSAGISNTFDLPLGVYYLKVAGLTSDFFRVITYNDGNRTPGHDALFFELSNGANLAEVPYQTGYLQQFGLPGTLCVSEPRTFVDYGEKSDRFGDKITYFRQYRTYSIDWPEMGAPLASLIKSLEVHDLVSIRDQSKTITVPGSRIKVTTREDSCCSLSVSLTLEETISEWGTCSDATELVEETLTPASIGYEDPADSDPEADPYTPSVGTEPTVDPTIPIAGTILLDATSVSTCADPFIGDDGLSYTQRRVTEVADGLGGSEITTEYSGLCEVPPSSVVVPTLVGIIKGIYGRIGVPINIEILQEALFGPATGHSQAPVITALNLPAGVTYAGGRLSGTPTTEGETTATLKVTQPGGGSILLPFLITTVAATPTTLELNVNVGVAYNPSSKLLTTTITAPFRPEVKQVGTGSSVTGFVLATPGSDPDTWIVLFPGVVSDGTLQLRRAGDAGTGITFPVNLPQLPLSPYPFAPFQLGSDIADGQLAQWKYDSTNNQYYLTNLLSIPAATWQKVMEAGAASTVSPILLGSLQTGDPNLVFQHTGTSTSGLIFKNLLSAFRGFFGLDTDDKLFFLQGSKEVFEFDKQQSNFFMDLLAGISTHAVFNRFSSVSMPVTKDYNSPLMGEYDSIRGRWDYKRGTLAEFFKQGFNTVNYEELWARLQPIANGDLASSKRLVTGVGCVTEIYEEEVDEPTEGFFTITPDMLNAPQTHNLNTPGSNLWRWLQAISPDDADDLTDAMGYMKVSFPSDTQYLVTPRDPDKTDFTGLLYLKKKTTV